MVRKTLAAFAVAMTCILLMSTSADARQLTGEPRRNQLLAWQMTKGWNHREQFRCLNWLVLRESGWRTRATNPHSGAYGIPQSLPGRKMASAGADWRTNPRTQITWMLGYVDQRYGSPCAAWRHSQRTGWY